MQGSAHNLGGEVRQLGHAPWGGQGGGADVVRQLLPEYASANVVEFAEGSLRGVARLFQPT